ncbi:hypothetical protein INR49_000510 [Caranx melampygus]|nr:hypothetical protein INR49_000510 [Caranx melampygus]
MITRRSCLSLVVCLCVLALPGRCCRDKEYLTRDGECCPMCHEGTVVRRDCTPLLGTSCSRCDNGTFMNQPNGLNKCFPCSTCAPAHGLFAQQSCTTTTDTVCEVLSGYYCRSLANNTGCSMAGKHTRCAPGQRVKEPGKKNFTVSSLTVKPFCFPCSDK